ncbi:MAG: ATP-grasp domain-containing protein [Planctomycetaceae bacterium]|mgnify:CR=1 FL=1|nr:ATP-grasp domain-containing protein [Planctomycetaceae bacterium]
MSEHLFIAGGSVRAAAQSAVRAGFRVTAADRFCDRDLADSCEAVLVSDYPAGILPLAQQLAPTAWLYTGGLENEPDLVDAVSHRHHLLGLPGSVLRQLRDPWQLSDVLARDGLRFPRPVPRPPHGVAGRWLVKPVRSCGGARIRWFDPRRDAGGTAPCSAPDPGLAASRGGGVTYYQPWIRGPAHGIIFLAAHGSATLLGVTRQLVGCVWAGAGGFQYVGSIGPIACDALTLRTLQRIGDCLAAAFPLCGLVGVDTIFAGTEIWTIEVNPRYTAAVEVLERATGVAAIGQHWDACQSGRLPSPTAVPAAPMYGKAVVYALRECTIGAAFYERLEAARGSWDDDAFADLPQLGTVLRAGQPILTVFAQGSDARTVHRRLRCLARTVHAWCDR